MSMKQEDKDLLLKDLCARLPYNVKAYVNNYWCDEYTTKSIIGVDLEEGDFLIDSIPGGRNSFSDVKPYLFPLSSMTEEQSKELDEIDPEFYSLLCENGDRYVNMNVSGFDWLNKNHFDYRGLIDKGLAIDATGLNIYVNLKTI